MSRCADKPDHKCGRCTRAPIEERFWAKVGNREPGGCWVWVGAVDPKTGYGRIMVEKDGLNRMENAHRVSFQMAKGPIPPGAFILHSCDQRACVNPDHLEAGTHQENMRQMSARGRQPNRKLTPESVRSIREMRSAGMYIREIAESAGVSKAAVKFVLNGHTWRCVA